MRIRKDLEETKAARGGDTSRSSSQGRKKTSGGQIKNSRKGNPEVDDDSKSEVSEKRRLNNPRLRRS